MIAVRSWIFQVLRRIYTIYPIIRLGWLFLIGFVGWTLLAAIIIRAGRAKLWSKCNWIFCVLFVLLLFYVTVASRTGTSQQEVIIQPFYSFFLARTVNREYYRSMLMNVFLFFPLGLMLPFALSERRNPVLLSLLIGLLMSVLIEILQYAFSLGRAETDDVIMNTLGVLIGSVSFILSKLILIHLRQMTD